MKRAAPDRQTLRALPGVATLLQDVSVLAVAHGAPRPLLVRAVRAAVARVRQGLEPPPGARGWARLVEAELARQAESSLRPVINATGIVLHTNLGRAPLAPSAIAAMQRVAAGYTTLEYDLGSGERGSRDNHCVELLRELTGAEDALVVNNCASGMVLALNTLAAGREVIISRGELVEIGGSFRIPDIMARSSARLIEVGTTNRTHLLDYRASVTPNTAAIVKVHRSNFAQSGYTADVPLVELAPLSAEQSLPLVFDLGSGLLTDLERFGFPPESTIARAVADGASLVLSSGDKLLGGPQAGIIVGRAELIDRLRSNPLARAVRVDKVTIAALESTLRLYLDPTTVIGTVPTLAMLCTPVERVRARAGAVVATLAAAGFQARVVDSAARVGAGAFPTHDIPSAAVALDGDPVRRSALLRGGDPAVVGYVRDAALLLDMRSVQPHEDAALATVLRRILQA